MSTTDARWLFSPAVDIAMFGGSALVALAFAIVGFQLGIAVTPEWAWISAVLLVDVAHVYATGFRVYFDPVERARRPWLYYGTPIIAYLIAIGLYTQGALVFWRAIAYLAVLHFVRQQAGWVALYRKRAGDASRAGALIDACAIYAATLYPLIEWHAHLPRRFSWFLAGDFVALPAWLSHLARPLWLLALTAYAIRALTLWWQKRSQPGKDLVVVTTACAWYLGIVAFNSDYIFTVANVFMHGIPYLIFVYTYASRRKKPLQLLRAGAIGYLGLLWLFAYVEELGWDRTVWHERAWLFGGAIDVGSLKLLVVPLLVLPQLTHYILDGFVWRRRGNPELRLFA